ncbi:SusC/RagA family TonB-linked outer membrane protein [Sphingobacterium sp. SGR-19]|uniref:SusC/RagA family TonB-linked outer membrane protein n=1 Tax=Sphingobacterium sp. SGR-19 TaxID=2710886 RepID=UPI0013ED19A3|nr:SusC/RagA family TonB-linked outer membrane protein [Sphingobacterium sp. SGR-19]NGM64851.1 SusC/RagA family TonB-linked outer membrane protein [Sphingobacterium sp. SGR-19]
MIKLTALFLCLGMVAVHADTYSQNVSVDIRNGKLIDLFEEIEGQSEYVFLYRDKLVADKKINITVKNENLQRLLKRTLNAENLDYTITGNQITIMPRKEVQQRVVSGTVRDEDGNPLAAANVLIKGSTVGTMTDDAGRYQITINGEVTLMFTLMGYQEVEENTRNRTRVDVVLRPDTRDIDEVVVTGYNQIERRHVASSVAEVNMERVANRPLFKLEEAFSGTVPGVTMLQGSNLPGAVPGSISIRGVSTLQSQAPLVIVDGMEQSLTDIDPNQVKSISVLKDAASASLYGSRGANGVIIIETHRGQAGQFKVDLHSWTGVSSQIDKPDFVNASDYMRLNNEARGMQGQTLLFSDDDIAKAESGETPSVDWLDAIKERTPYSHNTTANISGGGGVGSFNLMLGYITDNGLNHVEGSDKYSARFNTNINMADKFVLLADFYAHRLQVDRLMANTNGHGLYQDAWKMNPTQTIFYDTERPNHYALYNNINPVASIHHGGIRNNVHDRSTINLRPRYFITDNFSIDGNVSYLINKSAWKQERLTHRFYDEDGKPALIWGNNVDADQAVSSSQLTARANINYQESLFNGRDKIYLIAGTETMSHIYTDYREINKASFFGKLNYAFDERYLLEVTSRSDGSSKFAPGHRWGFFPSAALAWNAHNEKFFRRLRENGTINNLKFRFSYGLIGNENVAPYLWQEVVNNWGWTMRVPNPEFSWEKQKQWNVGMDLTALKNRLNVTAEVYHKHSYDLIYESFPVPPLTGAHVLESSVNIGEVENKGWELSANWSDKIGDFSYTVGGMLFDNVNRVLKAGYTNTDSLVFKGNEDKIWYRGIAIDNYYGYQSEGYYQNEEELNASGAKLPNTRVGDIRYVDQNGDGIINQLDRIDLGDPFPHLNYAINIDLRYKNWDFSMLGQGVGRRTQRIKGLEAYPVLMDGTENSLGTPRQYYMDNRWTPDNPNSRFPRVWTGATPNTNLSDVWLGDASYLRIKTLQLGYTIRNIGKSIRNVRFYVNAQDALTFTKWEGLDPEREDNHAGNGSYPRMATYSIGIRATIL